VNERGDSLRTLLERGLIPGVGISPQWSPDARTVWFMGEDSVSTAVFAVPAAGGAVRAVLRFDDPARPWHRFGFRAARDRFYFTLGARESHVWVAELNGGARE
jgi:hypothetical protein